MLNDIRPPPVFQTGLMFDMRITRSRLAGRASPEWLALGVLLQLDGSRAQEPAILCLTTV
jgi:hypothetical protein